MFKKLGYFTLCLSFAALLIAQSAVSKTLSWGASSGIIDGYRVYYHPYIGGEWDKSNYVDYINVGNTISCSTNILPLTQEIPYCIAVTAYNSAGESDFTNSIIWTLGDVTPPMPPIGLIKAN